MILHVELINIQGLRFLEGNKFTRLPSTIWPRSVTSFHSGSSRKLLMNSMNSGRWFSSIILITLELTFGFISGRYLSLPPKPIGSLLIISPIFSSKRFWNSKCSSKIKASVWFLLNDRLNIKGHVAETESPGQEQLATCSVRMPPWYQRSPLLELPFEQGVLGADQSTFDSDLAMENMIVLSRGSFSKPFFMEAFSAAAWSIWKQRNCKIFDIEP